MGGTASSEFRIAWYFFAAASQSFSHHAQTNRHCSALRRAYDNGTMTQQDSFNAANTLTQRVSYTGFDNLGNVLSYNIGVYTGTTYTGADAMPHAASSL